MKKIKIQPATIISILLTVPYFVGILWTTLHPILSVITGELKCRGQYIDENGLDVHRHRVETYPLKRRSDVLLTTASNSNSYQSEAREMCHAIHRLQSSSIISPSIECLHHVATETIEFDIVRIVPPLGPMIEATESIVLVVGEEDNDSSNSVDDWYKRSDLNASIMHLISKLGNKDDCPWLTKVVYIVSPTSAAIKMSEGVDTNATMSNERSSSYLTTVVDAFISSYLGDGTNNNNARSLPPEFTFPIIRSVLVINDVVADSINKATTTAGTEVRILPQGMSGSLPNLDLVFATYLSLQSHPAKKTSQQQRSVQSIFYGDKSKVMIHPFESDDIEKAVGRIMKRVCDMFGIQRSAVVEQYAKDLAGLFGFVAGLVIGP